MFLLKGVVDPWHNIMTQKNSKVSFEFIFFCPPTSGHVATFKSIFLTSETSLEETSFLFESYQISTSGLGEWRLVQIHADPVKVISVTIHLYMHPSCCYWRIYFLDVPILSRTYDL